MAKRKKHHGSKDQREQARKHEWGEQAATLVWPEASAQAMRDLRAAVESRPSPWGARTD